VVRGMFGGLGENNHEMPTKMEQARAKGNAYVMRERVQRVQKRRGRYEKDMENNMAETAMGQNNEQ